MLGFGKKGNTTPQANPATPVVNNVQNQALVGAAKMPGTNAGPAALQPQVKAGGHPVAKNAHPDQSKAYNALKTGSVSVVDIISPSSVEVDFKNIRVGDKYFRTFFVVDYPRQVSPNWLSILIDYKETMNISMFMYPVESKDVLSNLRRKISEMEATIQSDAENGMEPDPKITSSLEDAIALREELARGLERFFQFGLYVTLSADTVEELDTKTKELSTLLASNLLIMKPATLQMEEGFKTTLPMGVDKLFITRNMDTTSLASTFPFTSYEISHPNGILYGVNTINNSLAIVDRFAFENANEVVFGKSGSGKSFLVKLEILRQMMFDAEILIIDPEDEYKALCHALDGEYINFSKNSEVKINPFALIAEDMTDAQLGIKILSLHGLLKTMLGDMTPTQEAILDRAIVLCYKQKGITPDPATYKLEPPILEDLYKTLLNMEEPEAKDLSFRLEKYVKGGFSGLFNQQTNYDVKNQLTVFSLRQLEDVLRPIAMHVILDFVWNRVRTKLKKRILVVDEAWYLMQHPDSASFLQGIAKRARKYFLGVTTLTQDIEDFLNNDYGKSILSNSSVQILLKQNSSEVETLAKALFLSEGEKQFLVTAQVGEGLLFAGQNHITAAFVASSSEYDLITSKPQDIMDAQNNSAPVNEPIDVQSTEIPIPTAPIQNPAQPQNQPIDNSEIKVVSTNPTPVMPQPIPQTTNPTLTQTAPTSGVPIASVSQPQQPTTLAGISQQNMNIGNSTIQASATPTTPQTPQVGSVGGQNG
ncbi:MAG TPA: ATP-binding protein [Patescibacteria group bacterium]|nr:ATP-binding protein [Patescibacteria group bacterium]